MRELLIEWTPSEATIELLKLNGLDDGHIGRCIDYLKNNTELEDINKIEGYDSWDAFFIMFAIKAAGSPHKTNLVERERESRS